MESSLSSIFIILALLSTGFLSGKFLAPPLRQVLLKPLSFIVLLLLFFMGYEFGGVFTDPNLGADIVKYALLFALIISAFTLIALYRKPEASTASTSSPWMPRKSAASMTSAGTGPPPARVPAGAARAGGGARRGTGNGCALRCARRDRRPM